MDPPAGFEIREGMNYNPYFPGGAISMARVLFDGVVEYDDGAPPYFTLIASLVPSSLLACIGTPATTSQMAKDVVTFLNWAAEPEHDERKQYGLKAVILFSALTAISLYVKRFKWTAIKSRKISAYSLPHMTRSWADIGDVGSVQPAQEYPLMADVEGERIGFRSCHMFEQASKYYFRIAECTVRDTTV